MPQSIGTIIGDGEPIGSSATSGSANAAVGDDRTEILTGFDVEEPATERINTGAGDGVRRTKAGRIDRRTKAGRNGDTGRDGTETAGAEKEKSVSVGKIDLADALFAVHLTLSE